MEGKEKVEKRSMIKSQIGIKFLFGLSTFEIVCTDERPLYRESAV